MSRVFPAINRTLNKFDLQLLLELIQVVFPNIDVDKIINEVHKKKLPLNNRSIVQIFMQYYKEGVQTSNMALMDLNLLMFYDVCYNGNSIWSGIRLRDQMDSLPSIEDLEKNIRRSYRIDSRDVEVKLLEDNDIHYVMIIEKKSTKNGIKYSKPIFIAINNMLPEQYVFVSPKIPADDYHITLLSKALGFENYSSIDLHGKDVLSLYGMIHRQLVPERRHEAPEFIRMPVLEDNTEDYTGLEQRVKYAEALFPGLTNLQEFSVQASNEWCGHPYGSEQMEGVIINSSLHFQSSGNQSVEDLMRELIKDGHLVVPVPSYIANLPNRAGNSVQLDD